jgi:uncharacterized protein YegL
MICFASYLSGMLLVSPVLQTLGELNIINETLKALSDNNQGDASWLESVLMGIILFDSCRDSKSNRHCFDFTTNWLVG